MSALLSLSFACSGEEGDGALRTEPRCDGDICAEGGHDADAAARADGGAARIGDAYDMADSGRHPADVDANAPVVLPAPILGLQPGAPQRCAAVDAACACDYVVHHVGVSDGQTQHAVDGTGNVYVTYRRYSDAGDSDRKLLRFDASIGAWEDMDQLALDGRASLAADTSSRALVVSHDAAGTPVMYRFDPGADAWSTPAPMKWFPGHIVMTNGGAAIAHWQWDWANWSSAWYDPSSAAWSSFGTLDAVAEPLAAVNEYGALAISRTTMETGEPTSLGRPAPPSTIRRLSRGTLGGEIEDLNWDAAGPQPVPFVTSDGQSGFVVNDPDGGSRILAGTFTPGARALSDWVELGASDPEAAALVAQSPGGNVAVAWVHLGELVVSFLLAKGSTWSSPQPVPQSAAEPSDGGTAARLRAGVAVAPDGRVTVAWSRPTQGVRATHVDPSFGAWAEPTALGPSDATSIRLVDRNGHSVVLWRESRPSGGFDVRVAWLQCDG